MRVGHGGIIQQPLQVRATHIFWQFIHYPAEKQQRNFDTSHQLVVKPYKQHCLMRKKSDFSDKNVAVMCLCIYIRQW